MEKSAKTISADKWRKLSSKQKHDAIVKLALESKASGDLNGFENRYAELLEIASIDAWAPPWWLSDNEKLDNYFHFHQKFSGRTPEYYGVDVTEEKTLPWNPSFNVTVVLDQVITPYNIGSIVRVLDNFGLGGLVHGSEHFDPAHPQFKRAARGAEGWVPLRYEKDIPGFLKSVNMPVVGIELTDEAIPVNQWTPPAEFMLVLGNEAYGISEKVLDCCDEVIYIPMEGYKNSMNLSHALGICGYHISQKGSRIS